MAVDRNLLADALGRGTYSRTFLDASNPQRNLLQGQQISQIAMDSSNFGGGMAGKTGLAAQLATAGIGAFTQYRAQKEINERELASQEVFAQKFPHLADIAGTLSPETRQAYTIEALKSSLKSAEPMSPVAKLTADYKAGLIDEPTYQASLRKETSSGPQTVVNVGEQQNFKNATQLRGEYADKSKYFVGVKEGYEKVAESLKDPSPAGDIAAIFGFVKAQDPTSTVREGEFAIAQNAKPLLEKYGLEQYKNVWEGKRLTPSQRADFLARTSKLYERAAKSQEKLAGQYTSIARRNQLDPQDVIVDFSTSIEGSPSSKQAPIAAKQPTQPVSQLSVGTIKNGYKFIGGNPAKPESWEKI